MPAFAGRTLAKILKPTENTGPSMMGPRDEGQQMGSAAGVCNGVGQPGAVAAKRIPDRGEPYPAGASAEEAPAVGRAEVELAEIGKRVGRKARRQVACVAKP